MSDIEPARGGSGVVGHLARAVFLLAVIAAALWGLRGRWDEVAEAAAGVSSPEWGISGLLVMAGLLGTSRVWSRVLRAQGHALTFKQTAEIFFVGQLGKYVPGSLWSMAVQARMATALAVPVRTTVTTSLVFLVLHLVTASTVLVPVAVLVDLGVPQRWWVLMLAGAAVLALVPVVLRTVVRWVGGIAVQWEWADSAHVLALMSGVWCCYSAAVVPLLPQRDVDTVAYAAAAFALGYVAGVLVPLAPAGLGAREVVVVLVLAPVLGPVESTAVALLSRVVHTACDFLLAGVARACGRLQTP